MTEETKAVEETAKPKTAKAPKMPKVAKAPKPCTVCGDKGKTANGICTECKGTGRFMPKG